jgi:16S rRNA (uracil1498-N3)-methyltransferase
VAARFYSPDASGGGVLSLSDDESHHLRHVLRLGVGAELSVFNGRGQEWRARVADIQKRGAVVVELTEALTPVPEPSVRVTLGVGWLKGDQMDAVVRDATMLGAAAIVPIVSDHVSASINHARRAASVRRWTRIALASAKQCGRAVVPEIAEPEMLSELVHRLESDARLICVEPRLMPAAATDTLVGPRPADASVLVGPEGGWSPEELALADRHGFRRVHLGPRTLRAEAAPTVVLSALWATWGWT